MKGLSENSIIKIGVVILILTTGSGFAADYTLSYKGQISRDIAELVSLQEYETALKLADSVAAVDPSDPLGYFFKATILNVRRVDFEDEVDNNVLFAACDSVNSRVNLLFNKGDSSAVLYFYSGTTEIYKMMAKERRGSTIKIIGTILKSGKKFRKAVQLDSTLWDAFHAVGVFQYYKSARAGILRTLKIVKDERETGLNNIRIAAHKGYLTSQAAKSSLMWILLDMSKPVEAEQIARRMLQEYPGNRGFLWGLGKALTEQEKWEEAAGVYQKIYSAVSSNPRNNHYNEIGCLHTLAKASSRLERWEQLYKLSTTALELDISDDIRELKADDLANLGKYQKTAKRKLKSITGNEN